MTDISYGSGFPMGLGMALMNNQAAMRRFSSLPKDAQQGIIDRTHNIGSKEEMQAFVNSLA